MSRHRVVYLPGDGIGPEVAAAAREVVDASGMEIDWVDQEMGLVAFEKCGDALPREVIDAITECGVALKGPTTTPIGRGHVSANVRLRKELELFANVRPVKTVPGLETSHGPIDLVIVRENTESLYAGLENEVAPGVVTSIKVITDRASRRIARFAFEYAQRWGRKTVTAVHKANIMKKADGLFLRCAQEEAAKVEGKVAFNDVLVDALCMHLVTRPSRYDVLLLENLYGDIVSDLAAGLIGGLGLAPGGNYGEKGAVFEAIHGSAPDIAGKGIANPIAMILSAAMMCHHLGDPGRYRRIRRGVAAVTRERKDALTPDLGGTGTTASLTKAIIEEVQRQPLEV
ncbi:MAG: isocitrate/isopropylmalate dehydrogenase family protein [Planctomycetota bacterium]|nr:isocitrate/isopropylmalate dehydrogenase family protein [Planctomycetota bacterium]MCB9825173.1 isocitrate/isopropylmalate dehydrogenase family protein [Planctomycetota bacterium]MCB9901996.1 isocitrate/isopropylmalate dehydrogenase family protein [Planctomycetota bacterium]